MAGRDASAMGGRLLLLPPIPAIMGVHSTPPMNDTMDSSHSARGERRLGVATAIGSQFGRRAVIGVGARIAAGAVVREQTVVGADDRAWAAGW